MNTGVSSEEKLYDDKELTLFKENSAKSTSPLLNEELFSLNTQELLNMDFEIEDCQVTFKESCCLFDDYEENQTNFSVYLNKGGKKHMEDRVKIVKISDEKSFFGIYDGHGSADVADFLVQNLHGEILENENFENDPINTIINSFHKIDSQILSSQSLTEKNMGSVAICALIIKNILYIINLGDSKAVMVDKEGSLIDLSDEHIPNRPDELDRIEKLGGFVVSIHHKHRIMGELAVSRAFGDKYYKPFVSSTPEVYTYKLDKNNHKYIILASDGLWNEINKEDLKAAINEKSDNRLAKRIFNKMVEKNEFASDNTAIICIDVEKILDFV